MARVMRSDIVIAWNFFSLNNAAYFITSTRIEKPPLLSHLDDPEHRELPEEFKVSTEGCRAISMARGILRRRV